MGDAKPGPTLAEFLGTLPQPAPPDDFEPVAWYVPALDRVEVFCAPQSGVMEPGPQGVSVMVDPADRTRVLGFQIASFGAAFGTHARDAILNGSLSFTLGTGKLRVEIHGDGLDMGWDLSRLAPDIILGRRRMPPNIEARLAAGGEVRMPVGRFEPVAAGA